MSRHRDADHLSSGDALFLYLEREGMPLNVASVSIFEGNISLHACRRFIESKLPLIPRYRQRVAPPPFGIGLPAWEFDPDFDIRNHVHQMTVEQGSDAGLKTAAAVILSKVMDRRRPLWDFTLLRGLNGNRTGIVTRIHHCMADGLAGVGLMNALMDPSPQVRPLPRHSPQFPSPRRKSPALLEEVIASSLSMAQRVLTAQMELCTIFQNLLANGRQRNGSGMTRLPKGRAPETPPPQANDLARLLLEVSAATQPLPFNVICRGPQQFCWTQVPLAEIKAVKNACSAKVNDVALAVVTRAFQRYAEMRGADVTGRLLRLVVPVSVRGKENQKDLGNHITFLPISIPLDIRDPRKLVAAVQKRTLFLKGAHLADCVGVFGTMLGTIPTAAQELIGPFVSQIPLGLCNLIFTNVPGPAEPLYLLGHKLLRCYPYVPIGGDMGINCAMLTYNGIAYFGITGDIHAAPDLPRLERLIKTSFTELRDAVGVRPERPRRAPAKPQFVITSVAKSRKATGTPEKRIPPKPAVAPATTPQKREEPQLQVVA